MPIPLSEVALYRAALRDVNTLAQRDLLRSWREFDLADAAAVRDGLLDTLPGIADKHHLMSATVAADWYDLMRAEAGVPRRFDAVMPDQPNRSRALVLGRWAVSPMFAGTADPTTTLSKVSGGLQRVVTDGARDTITTSSIRDPARPGWTRVGTGRCAWCAERIGLHITSDVVFSSHDACGCTAVPGF